MMWIKASNVLRYLEKMDLKYKFIGNSEFEIKEYSSIKNIKNMSITWIKDIQNVEEIDLDNITGLLVISNEIRDIEMLNKNINFIFCENPKEVFFSILQEFFKKKDYTEFISPNSVVETKFIGKNVYIGHNCCIEKNVTIGENVIIKNNVSIQEKVIIGRNTIIHSGVVIGTDGYGYFNNSEGQNVKVPHFGGVVIGRNVEIGANTCIDRGTLDDTIIGDNVKIDNLCHIAHNVVIKENCNVIALSMLAGSVILEKNAYIAPGALVKNQLTIGENSLVGLGAVVIKNVEANKVVAGVPAKVIKDL